MEIFYWEKAFHAVKKKTGKMTLAPQKNFPVTPLFSGGVEELQAFPAILHLSGTLPEARSKMINFPMEHTSSQGQPHLIDVQLGLWRSPLEIWQIGRALGRRPA